MSKHEIQRQRRADAQTKCNWREEFSPKLKACTTLAEAWTLSQTGPRPDAIGRLFHSNLGFFLQSEFRVPNEATAAERALYVGLINRLADAGVITREAREAVTAALANAPSWP